MIALKDVVIYKTIDKTKETKAGIIIPAVNQGRLEEGEIVSLGEDVKKEEPCLKVGDKILVEKRYSTEAEIDEEKYKIVRLNNVIVKL